MNKRGQEEMGSPLPLRFIASTILCLLALGLLIYIILRLR